MSHAVCMKAGVRPSNRAWSTVADPRLVRRGALYYILYIYIYVTVSGKRVHSAQNVHSSYKRL